MVLKGPSTTMPSPENPRIISPRIAPPVPMMRRPLTPAPLMDDPSSVMSGVPAKPGWVVPSIVTGPEMTGSAAAGVIVRGPSRWRR
jgi:hypothetical protein